MTFATLLAAVSIAFPPEGARLPHLERCYVMGAADAGEENVAVYRDVSSVRWVGRVTRSGAWATVINVVPGRTNIVYAGEVRRAFFVTGTNGTSGTSRTYKKLEYAGDSAKPHPAGKKPGEVTIVIDAGHGGDEDLGAVSPHGLPEKDANLRLAKVVAANLRAKGFDVVMTRTDDVEVGLYDRPKVAHAAKADAFVSLHHNAPGHASNPFEVRYQATYAWNPIGEKLAAAIERRMAAARPNLRSRGVVHANFAVTRNPEIPSCLVEADFITHPDGELAAWDASQRAPVAAAIADGIADWVAGK